MGAVSIAEAQGPADCGFPNALALSFASGGDDALLLVAGDRGEGGQSWAADAAGSVAVGTYLPEGAPLLFGESVAFIGDHTGDGLEELAVGGPGEGCGEFTDMGDGSGLFVYDAYPSGSVSTDDAISALGHETRSDYAWTIKPLGDIDGDGYPEVAMSYATADYICYGALVGTIDAHATYSGGGWELAGLHSLNDDTSPDLMLLGRDDDIQVFLSPIPFGTLSAENADLTISADWMEWEGSTQAILADPDGDGIVDVVLGDPDHSTATAEDAGIIAVIELGR